MKYRLGVSCFSVGYLEVVESENLVAECSLHHVQVYMDFLEPCLAVLRQNVGVSLLIKPVKKSSFKLLRELIFVECFLFSPDFV